MIRLKSKDADLKRTYMRDLWAAVGFVVLLLAAVVAIDPQIVLDAGRPVQRPTVIELELVPATEMRLPLPPPVRRIEPVAYARPVREHKLPPPVVVTEFPWAAEEEVAELWMVEQPPKVLKKVMPAYPDSARRALVEGKVFARVLVGRGGGESSTSTASRGRRSSSAWWRRPPRLGSSCRLCKTTAPSRCGSACRLYSSWSDQPPACLA